MRLAGEWGTPTIDGPREIVVGGYTYAIPEDAEVRVVTGVRGIKLIHVRHARPEGRGHMVTVLAEGRQLLEDEWAAAARAAHTSWAALEDDDRDYRSAARRSAAARARAS